MSVIELLRDATARRTAIYAYAQAHDHFSELEQTFTASGDVVSAEGAHQYALIALRAYRNESDDPDAKEHDCPRCHDDNAREGR